jgi:hypothetical protein
MDVEYLNTDLEVESFGDLAILVTELGEDATVLYNGKAQKHNLATFEVGEHFLNADEAINHFCLLIEGLSAKARNTWNKCVSRVFDLGYESGDSANCFRTELRNSTVRRAAALGASIVITIYPMGLPTFNAKTANKSFQRRRPAARH